MTDAACCAGCFMMDRPKCAEQVFSLIVRKSLPSAGFAVFPSGVTEIIHRRVNGCTLSLEPCSSPVSVCLCIIDARLTQTPLGHFLKIRWVKKRMQQVRY